MRLGKVHEWLVAWGCTFGLLLGLSPAHARSFDEDAEVDEKEARRSSKQDPPKDTNDDQSQWVGRVGVGFYGLHHIPLPQAHTTLLDASDPNSPFQLGVDDIARTTTAPAIGLRYWFSRDLGLDVAIGFWTESGTDKSTDPNGTRENDLESKTAFLLHGGLPIVLGGGKHVSVQLTPQVNLGIASGKWSPAATGGNLPPSVEESGVVFQMGSRIGAEVFFGFIGMPELSLDASLGLYLQTQKGKISAGNTEASRSSTSIGTHQFNSPWDFFTSSLAARYYF